MQRVMRLANWAAVGLYRRTGGRIGGSAKGVDVLLLTVSGRRTGKPFTVPVAYLPHGVGYVVTGSADGMKDEPQWFRNLRVTDRAEVQIARTRTPVVSRVAEGRARRALAGGGARARPLLREVRGEVGADDPGGDAGRASLTGRSAVRPGGAALGPGAPPA